MLQKQIGSISNIGLWQAGILHFKITRKLKKPTLESLNPFDMLTALSTVEGPRILSHFLPTNFEMIQVLFD